MKLHTVMAAGAALLILSSALMSFAAPSTLSKDEQRLFPAVLMLDSLTSEPTLPAPEKARLCAAARTELVCS